MPCPRICEQRSVGIQHADLIEQAGYWRLPRHRLSIGHDNRRGRHWLALQTDQIELDDGRVINVDAHVTLANVDDDAWSDQILTDLTNQLSNCIASTRGDHFRSTGYLNSEKAKADYCWIDLHCQSNLHRTVSSISSIASRSARGPVKRRSEFHISFRSFVTFWL